MLQQMRVQTQTAVGVELKLGPADHNLHIDQRQKARSEMEAVLADAQQLLVDERFSEYV
jgi:hypothetical protein